MDEELEEINQLLKYIGALDYAQDLRRKEIEKASEEEDKRRLIWEYEKTDLERKDAVGRYNELKAKPMGVWEKRYRDAVNKFLTEVAR